MSWFKRGGSRPTSPEASKPDMNKCDPEACFEVFQSHWHQAFDIIRKVMPTSGIQTQAAITNEDVEAVVHYFTQMVALLVEERDDHGSQGPILRTLLTENMLEILHQWCSHGVEFSTTLTVEQLKIYDMIASPTLIRQELLVHKPIIRPMLKLLSSCAETEIAEIEMQHMLVLHHLCIALSRNIQLLELFFNASSDHGSTKFLIFSLLIPYVHREGNIGQQARDALLLIMALSSQQEAIGKYIAENSDFCPVLATGLSGRYSMLPRKIKIPADDWYRLEKEDWLLIPELSMFLNSLEFCNAVIQISDANVSSQLIKYICSGFLVPVLGPALHQNSMEEIIAATAYLDLFIRQITEPSLVYTFLKFILTGQHDEINILDSLITRINSNSRLCMVSLSLFKTLVDMNCEDVMYELVLKYLIPCTHVMVSQRRSIIPIDMYGKTAEKFLSLRPACCNNDTGDCQMSRREQEQESTANLKPSSPSSPTNSPTKRSMFGRLFKHDDQSPLANGNKSYGSPQMPASATIPNAKPEQFESSYMTYLGEARRKIRDCSAGCHCWSAPYNGENPAPDSVPGGKVLQSPRLSDKSVMEMNNLVKKVLPPESNNQSNSLVCGKAQDIIVVDVHRNSSPKPSATSAASGDANHIKGDNSQIQDIDNNASSEIQCDAMEQHKEPVINNLLQDESVTQGSEQSKTTYGQLKAEDLTDFLLTLKRVNTPVEICDNSEESFNEMDKIFDEYKYACSSNMVQFTGANTTQNVQVPSFKVKTDFNNSSDISHMVRESEESTNSKSQEKQNLKENSPKLEDLQKFDSAKSAHEALKSLPLQNAENEKEDSPHVKENDMPATSMKSSTSAFTPLKPKAASLTTLLPTKYNTSTPNIGPFLCVILNKLESMTQNSLYVNLLLSGLLARLSYYPQPLLRSFLLNHNLVFQPTVKSLIQVLGSVKQKVDSYALTVQNFDQLLLKARQYLAWREQIYYADVEGRASGRTDGAPTQSKPNVTPPVEPAKGKKKVSISDLLFRRSTNKQKHSKPRLELTASGYKFINTKPGELPQTPVDSLRTKNAVYCALLLEEFVKELAAVSQEHAVLSPDEGYHSN